MSNRREPAILMKIIEQIPHATRVDKEGGREFRDSVCKEYEEKRDMQPPYIQMLRENPGIGGRLLAGLSITNPETRKYLQSLENEEVREILLTAAAFYHHFELAGLNE